MVAPNSNTHVFHDERGRNSSIHPAQQRLSCEACRKHKAKCRRIKAGDFKCGRCLMYNIDCNVGKQRRIGRPRRALAAATNSPPSFSISMSPSSETPALLDVGLSSLDDSAKHPESASVASLPIPSMSFVLPTPDTPLPNPDIEHALALSLVSAPTLCPQPSVETTSGSMATLSLINLELYNRMQAAQAHKDILDLDLILSRRGPLFINNLSLVEFTVKVSREYLSVLTNLHSTVSHQKSFASDPLLHDGLSLSIGVPHEPLTAPVALAITSVFTQLLDLYELNLRHLLARLKRAALKPMASTPLPGLAFGTYNVDSRCQQGIVFIATIHNLLQRMEVSLGISWEPGRGDGVLSTRQMHSLWNEISDEFGLNITRPNSIKNSIHEATWRITHQDPACPGKVIAGRIKELTKAQSSLLSQTRTGHIGLSEYPAQGRVPGVEPPCQCGAEAETFRPHTPRLPSNRSRRAPSQDSPDGSAARDCAQRHPDCPAILRWVIRSGHLPGYKLAAEWDEAAAEAQERL
ncbi:uncharacterized protein DNG_02126 [Cephalotrichum gorgonifer]|uniref:Zn(2)-C6 fungal-type domain-containing protein n=1 Tax=Cephalotrichum gorgonifer TaxID=2041049 RepID=A0AAE8SS88_9PEZI|nr:uncharacterized protein DNG_02126 [Cephalotrichum gorgonifer]